LYRKRKREYVPTYFPYQFGPELFPDMALPIPIGYTWYGLIVQDLAELPHIRVGGTTFTGKSNWLHTVVASLIQQPNVQLAIIDPALLEFSYMRKYAAFAADLDSTLDLLRLLEAEMHRRRRILDKAGVVKIQDYRGDDLPYIVLIIDEFSFVNKPCHDICSNLAAMARKVGIHLIIAMQRPDMKILPGILKANLPGALSFRTINRVNSEIILDNGAAAELPNIKGRAIWMVGNTQVEVQTMHLPIGRAKRELKLLSPREVMQIYEPDSAGLLPR
jgi:S-DNA-T family DNA segregation ATPase FtsK/SpoIIIE